MKNRSSFWDIIKAIGIISIVLGHCSLFFYKYVYIYHLVIFIFVSGFLFNRSKYKNDFWGFFAKKFKDNYKQYLLYFILFILIHNLLLSIGIYSTDVFNMYTLKDIVLKIVEASFFLGTEPMGGALWFIVVSLYSSLIFCLIVNFSEKIKNKLFKDSFIILVSIMFGILGISFTSSNSHIYLFVHISFLFMPILMIGNEISKIGLDKLKKYLNLPFSIICWIFILLVLNKTNTNIDLSSNMIISPILFYPVSLAGIYSILYLGKLIDNSKHKTKDLISYIGRNSFHIMALHFIMFKIVDLAIFVIYKLTNHNNDFILSAFPVSNNKFWSLYTIVGIFGPILIVYLISKFKKRKTD